MKARFVPEKVSIGGQPGLAILDANTFAFWEFEDYRTGSWQAKIERPLSLKWAEGLEHEVKDLKVVPHASQGAICGDPRTAPFRHIHAHYPFYLANASIAGARPCIPAYCAAVRQLKGGLTPLPFYSSKYRLQYEDPAPQPDRPPPRTVCSCRFCAPDVFGFDHHDCITLLSAIHDPRTASYFLKFAFSDHEGIMGTFIEQWFALSGDIVTICAPRQAHDRLHVLTMGYANQTLVLVGKRETQFNYTVEAFYDKAWEVLDDSLTPSHHINTHTFVEYFGCLYALLYKRSPQGTFDKKPSLYIIDCTGPTPQVFHEPLLMKQLDYYFLLDPNCPSPPSLVSAFGTLFLVGSCVLSNKLLLYKGVNMEEPHDKFLIHWERIPIGDPFRECMPMIDPFSGYHYLNVLGIDRRIVFYFKNGVSFFYDFLTGSWGYVPKIPNFQVGQNYVPCSWINPLLHNDRMATSPTFPYVIREFEDVEALQALRID